MFKAGTKVRFKPNRWNPENDLPADGIFVVGAVVSLPNPDHYYVDPHYWDTTKYAWAREKTRLDVARHPQVVFLDGVPACNTGLPHFPSDPENKNRRAFSGAWFDLA